MTLQEKVDALNGMFNTTGWKDILKPALVLALDNTVNMWYTGQRPQGEESVTDGELKQRAFALKWVLDWESKREIMLQQLEQRHQLEQATEPATEGGSPYD